MKQTLKTDQQSALWTDEFSGRIYYKKNLPISRSKRFKIEQETDLQGEYRIEGKSPGLKWN